MVELGKYAITVLSAYGVTLALLAGLVLATLWQGARVRRALEEQEKRMNNRG
ncbi:MAG TPA: heme exporter protein CcmD [Paracoccaceae bacterium]|nr:heme exporter protein CcmD [Paracoccaceae bacterium]